MIVNYKSIFKLKVMLDNAEIPYEFIDISYYNGDMEYPFFQIIVYKNNQVVQDRLISVIEGHGTYGESQDLLEIQGCLTSKELENDSVLGYLSAQEVFKRIKNNYGDDK